MNNGREKKTKSSKSKSAVDAPPLNPPPEVVKSRGKKGSKRDKWTKGGNDGSDTNSDDNENDAPRTLTGRAPLQGGGLPLAEHLFVQWSELLSSRERLKRRLDSLAALHGWEAASTRLAFLGGLEPSSLLSSISSELLSLSPASDSLDKADLLLELAEAKERLKNLEEERGQLAADVAALNEDCFEARDLLAEQAQELERRRAQDHGGDSADCAATAAGRKEGGGGNRAGPASSAAASGSSFAASFSCAAGLSLFDTTLERAQVEEGRSVIEQLQRLKLPDEDAMGSREKACWHENKKTIVNSLKTLSSQIYSQTTRIFFEIIQNADDCSFHDASSPELILETSDEALVAFHNEKGFQPKDIYAMCQVGESSKLAGSGKIGRKGIGFKSVFQISDRPVVLSPPFQFCFDTVQHGVFGYIVPSWIADPAAAVPPRHQGLLRKLVAASSSDAASSASGTLLVCPIAQRMKGVDLMRDLNFDGLSLAFLKNLQKISFASSSAGPASPFTTHEYRLERTDVFQRTHADLQQDGLTFVLKDAASALGHSLHHCEIVEDVASGGESTRTSRHYRVHVYEVHRHRAGASAGAGAATTTIKLAFPVTSDKLPHRSEDGELVFAYLPVTAAGFGFAMHADFELTASRQDVSDSNHGNHVLLNKIPALFVHAILSDPVLGEDAFATYLPDLGTIRQDRSGSNRKWFALASALHQETSSWMMIPTEDGAKVRRRHVVLRPKHLSVALVPNSLLKIVTSALDSPLNFAHEDAVVTMCLSNCLDVCPTKVILDCIRVVLDRVSKQSASDATGGNDDPTSCKVSEPAKHSRSKKKSSKEGEDLSPESSNSNAAIKELSPLNTTSISDDMLVEIWRYLSAEYESCVAQGEKGKDSLRLIVDALIGGVVSRVKSLRIFPVRGTRALRLHSEGGVAICRRLAPSLLSSGDWIVRLAERIVLRLDMDRLAGIDGIEALLRFIRVGDATEAELQHELKVCFRFGFATTTDPQLWWDAYRYAVTLGHALGLADFMPGTAIALPVTDVREGVRVVSSRDVQRLSIALPCILGLRRKTTSNKNVLALPTSAAATFGSRVRWELAMVEAFGATFSKIDVDRIQMGAFAGELFLSISECRDQKDVVTLRALSTLLGIYDRKLHSFTSSLRTAAKASRRCEECLLETRSTFLPFTDSCSPRYIDELLEYAGVTLRSIEYPCYHDTRSLLIDSLGMLQLRAVKVEDDEQASLVLSPNDMTAFEDKLESGDSAFIAVNEEFKLTGDRKTFVSSIRKLFVANGMEAGDCSGDDDGEEHHSAALEDACDEATWTVLEKLLNCHHTFDAVDCPWLLYSVLTPKLSADGALVERAQPLVTELSSCSLFRSSNFSNDVWPLILESEGIWLGSDFVPLDSCTWKGNSAMWASLLSCCPGPIIDIERRLRELANESSTSETETQIAVIGECCLRGSLGRKHPPLPHPTDLEMLVYILRRFLGNISTGDDVKMRVDDLSRMYAYVIAADSGLFAPGRRWKVPMLTAVFGYDTLGFGVQIPSEIQSKALNYLVVDRGLNPLLDRDAAELLVYPDTLRFPEATRFVVEHFPMDCLHSELAPVFAAVADRQSVGFTSPRTFLQRNFDIVLRRIVANCGGLNWNLIKELTSNDVDDRGSGLSDENRFELLLAAATVCARQWHNLQLPTSGQADASRYQETLANVRRIVPFVETTREGLSWSSLAARGRAPLVLSSLFGVDLWSNVNGITLRNNDVPPSFTNHIPVGARDLTSAGAAALDRSSLVLVWEWFLLEVAGAAPPAVLWSSIQEPIAARARPRIRAAETSLREGRSNPASLEVALLSFILEQTQAQLLLVEMDAADLARQRAAQEALRQRQLEREEARRARVEEEAARRRAAEARRTESASAMNAARAAEEWRRNDDAEREREMERERQRIERLLQSPFNSFRSFFGGWDIGGGGGGSSGGGGSGGGGGGAERRHTQGATMQESEVKGKLTRFLCGMRAYLRSQGGSGEKTLPTVLSEFIVWAGETLGGDAPNAEPGGAGAVGSGKAPKRATTVDMQALKYVGFCPAEKEADEDCCAICLEGLGDAEAMREFGEPVITHCGHKYHAICFARHLEAAAKPDARGLILDPWCPVCRSADLTASFR